RIVIRDHHADGQERRPNGELKSLRTMLRQSSGQVPVRLDVEVDGQVAVLDASNIRVQPSRDMARQVEGILQDTDCCLLLGREKLAGSAAG
ncbi:MAG: hypothetical protein OER86_01570, partial [Phycisphaerae bacterium]|nr:hypothetical protein [Phycisphaerae bacterium]